MENKATVVQKFLSQSYEDALKNHLYKTAVPTEKTWDYVVITASNEKQSLFFKKQIAFRKTKKLIPDQTHYLVLPDPEGKRVGSGGATLNVLATLSQIDPDFLSKKILLIHSGGDSKRIPQYSSCGKLFSPIPRLLSGQFRSTLFDELLISMSSVSDREENGMLVIPGDTEFIFNPLQIDFDSCDAASLSLKVSAEIGKDHGVFLCDENRFVDKFLHKLPAASLKEKGATDKDGNVFLDTGCIWLSKKVEEQLLSLILENGKLSLQKIHQFINDKVRLNFYADFVYPMAQKAEKNEYQAEMPEGDFSNELSVCRNLIWEKLHSLKTKVIQLEPASYIHFGTMPELLDVMTKNISSFAAFGWQKNILTSPRTNGFASSLSLIQNSQIGNSSYIEDSVIKNCIIGQDAIISFCTIENKRIPDGVMLHTLKLMNGKFVTRILGINENPKSTIDGPFLGSSLRKLANQLGISVSELSPAVNKTIWNSNIYPQCESQSESVDFALFLYNAAKEIIDQSKKTDFLKLEKTSLETSFNQSDTDYIARIQGELRDQILLEQLIGDLSKKENIPCLIQKYSLLPADKTTKELLSFAKKPHTDYLLASRIYLFISAFLESSNIHYKGLDSNSFSDKCFSSIKEAVEKEHFAVYPMKDKIFHPLDNTVVKMPLRVNFCGSPSDAAPYCLEYGGTELNAAILLNGKEPIVTSIRRIKENKILFESEDLHKSASIDDIDAFKTRSSINDFSLLYRSTIIASGLFNFKKTKSFTELMKQTGGGFEITTSVNVPKGSGLGTSSLLIACILKALAQFFQERFSDQQIYSQVFLTEQLMTTGGGWQDQVGGLTPGVKLISTKPGPFQTIHIDYADLSDSTKKELNDRFALIFSGQRRLAKNVLKQEMTKLFQSDQIALESATRVQELCSIMKFELEKGNIDSFGKHITEQFGLVQNLDKGASNSCIDYIFEVCSDLICGKSICGAGGGGFLMVILKKGVTRQDLQNRINAMFRGCGVSVWDSEFQW
jgi:fucokinase